MRPEPYDTNCDPPSDSANAEVIDQPKNRKATRENSIALEVYKTCLSTLIGRL